MLAKWCLQLNKFEFLDDGIYRLCVPFGNIYTSVFAISNGEKWIICDTATTVFDVKNHILPALRTLGATPDYILVSHSHSDHCGGLPALLTAFPNAVHITNPTVLLNRFEVISLKGHTEDSLAILDMKTRTLLSFDCLQQCGIDKYRDGITDKTEYLKSIDKVKRMDLKQIIFSHDYDPCGYRVSGVKEIANALKICEEYAYNFETR